MKFKAMMMAVGLALGVAATPAVVSAQPAHYDGRHHAGPRGDHGPGGNWRGRGGRDHRGGYGYRDRGRHGYHGRRQVCRTEWRHHHRERRCFWR